MSSEETRTRRFRHRRRNLAVRELKDPGDHKGAYHMKIHDDRKGEYRRIKMKVTDYDNEESD